uniref:Uncharacterized protein n=1 Tax=Arundo donax TaxID=35708 RepID=A0A0A8ZYK0_ARUDO
MAADPFKVQTEMNSHQSWCCLHNAYEWSQAYTASSGLLNKPN